MLSVIWEFVIILMEAILFFILVNNKLNTKSIYFVNSYVIQTIVNILGCVLLFAMNINNVSSIYTMLFSIIFHLVYVFLFFSDSASLKVIWVVIYTALSLLADSLSSIIPLYLLRYNKEQVLTMSGTIRVIFTLVYILIFAFLISVALIIFNKKILLSTPDKITFWTISISTILVEHMQLLTITHINDDANHSDSILQIIVFILVFMSFITMIFYVYNLGIERIEKLKIYDQMLYTRLQNEQYNQLISSTEELRAFKHDVDNHITTLSYLINKEETDRANEYIKRISMELTDNYSLISSGNIAFDCIISNKLSVANCNNISVDYTVLLPEKIPLSDSEICSLMGNLLDNAIEANNNLSSYTNKFINLNIKPYNNMLSIRIENSYNGQYKRNKGGMFLTTKTDNNKHGIGTNTITNIINNHKGIIRFTPEKNTFIVDILLPLENT